MDMMRDEITQRKRQIEYAKEELSFLTKYQLGNHHTNSCLVNYFQVKLKKFMDLETVDIGVYLSGRTDKYGNIVNAQDLESKTSLRLDEWKPIYNYLITDYPNSFEKDYRDLPSNDKVEEALEAERFQMPVGVYFAFTTLVGKEKGAIQWSLYWSIFGDL